MDKKISLTNEAHKKLCMFKAEHECRTFSDALIHSFNTHDKKMCEKIMAKKEVKVVPHKLK